MKPRFQQRCECCGRFFKDPDPNIGTCSYSCWAELEERAGRFGHIQSASRRAKKEWRKR